MSNRINQVAVGVLFAGLLLLGYWLFLPALSGPFFIDDAVHLQKMATYGGITDWRTLQEFVFSGTSGSGRPLSFLAMLIDDQYWPTKPYAFKHTNLMIHLLNGCLVFWFFLLLLRLLEYQGRGEWLGLLAASLWLLHPIQLSTMMLVIQRMTLVMATFNLLGLIVYLKGRTRLRAGQVRLGYSLMTLGLGLAGVLGILAKDPGVMVAAYVLVIEYILLRDNTLLRERMWRVWSGVFLWGVLAALVVFFIYSWPGLEPLFLKRNFSAWERVLTEFRVLIDYAKIILVPQISSMGPFHDDYGVSRSLLQPFSTLICALLTCALLVWAWCKRAALPVLSAAVIWFFVGHALEASIMPIELYFEHRNYLPMLLISLAIAWLILKFVQRSRMNGGFFASLYVTFILFMSVQSAEIWGNQALQSLFWIENHPQSMRASVSKMTYLSGRGDVQGAYEELERFERSNPENSGVSLAKFLIRDCRLEYGASRDALAQLLKRIPYAIFEHTSTPVLEALRKRINSGSCPALDSRDLLNLMDAYLSNPVFAGLVNVTTSLNLMKAKIYTAGGDFNGAMIAYEAAYNASERHDIAINQAMLAITAMRLDLAEEYIALAERKPRNRYLSYQHRQDVKRARMVLKEIKEKKQKLISELEKK